MEASDGKRHSLRRPLCEDAVYAPSIIVIRTALSRPIFLYRACNWARPGRSADDRFRGLWDRRRIGAAGIDAPRFRGWFWDRPRIGSAGVHVPRRAWLCRTRLPRRASVGTAQRTVAVAPTIPSRCLWRGGNEITVIGLATDNRLRLARGNSQREVTAAAAHVDQLTPLGGAKDARLRLVTRKSRRVGGRSQSSGRRPAEQHRRATATAQVAGRRPAKERSQSARAQAA